MTRGGCHLVTRRQQRGAIGVLGALLLATVAIGALVSIDVGHVFYRQRELQKIADMAALAGAQQLKQAAAATTVSANVLSATQSAGTQNGYAGAASANCSTPGSSDGDGMRVCLGVWDPAFTTGSDTVRHFNAGYDTTKLSANAVQVVVTQTVPILFVLPGGASRQLRAEAIANASPPVASFSIGSGLLDVNTGSSVLGNLLGTTVQLSVLDWQGLANANVTLDQLRLKLGVGTIDDLLKTSLSIQQFYALVLGAAGKSSLLSAALGSPPTQLGLSGVKADVGLGKLLNLGVLAPAASSAADVALNVAQLLMLGAQVANGNSAVQVGLPPINVAGLTSIGAQLYVVQPPVMAVGPARQLSPGVWQTSAHTAQIGLRLDLVVKIDVASLTGVDINLPLYVEVAAATASLQGVQCAAANADCRATLGVNTGLVKACLATASGSGCASGPVTLIDATILGTGLSIVASGNPRTGAVGVNSTTVNMAPGTKTRVGTPQPLSGVVKDVLGNLNLNVAIKVGSLLTLNVPLPLADLLAPLFSGLDAILGPLLGALGIQLGYADIWMHGIDCNNAELVF